MKVYYEGRDDGHRMFVQPGTHHADVSEWMQEGKPILMEVKFNNGVAEVPENLGKYLIDKGLVRKSRIILPNKRLN